MRVEKRKGEFKTQERVHWPKGYWKSDGLGLLLHVELPVFFYANRL